MNSSTDLAVEYPGVLAYSPEIHPLGYSAQSIEVEDISQDSLSYADTHEALSQLDSLLAQHPEWKGPRVSEDRSQLILDPNNLATTALYGDENVEAARLWRTQLVPSALALETLALKTNQLPRLGTEIDKATRQIFLDSADARAIRMRGTLMAELLVEHAKKDDSFEPRQWLSLACGAARPVLEAVQRVQNEALIGDVKVTLVDNDTEVLDYATKLADSMDLDSGDHTEIETDLRRSMIAKDTLVEQLGAESMDVVDLLGFLEYCPDKAAVRMLKNAYRLVAPGGVLITANMRDDRPERHIHERGIGWPGVQMRSEQELIAIMLEAGIDPKDISLYKPNDNVYNVLKIEKPAIL